MQPDADLVYYLIAGGVGAIIGFVSAVRPQLAIWFHAYKIIARSEENLKDAEFIRRDAAHILAAAERLRVQADELYGNYMEARSIDGSRPK